MGFLRCFKPGVLTYEFWLKAGIVLLGSRFLLGDVLKLGGISLSLVVLELAVAFTFMTFLGRWFKLKPKLTSLLAVGSAVCGVSAIIATKGAIDADDEDSSYAIAAILALGRWRSFTFPLIGHWLHLSDRAYGMWAGLAVDNTAEATAAGALYSDAAGKIAVLAKTTRNAMIGFVVLGYAHLLGQQRPGAGSQKQSRVPVAEVSQVRAGISVDFRAGHLGSLRQRASWAAWRTSHVGRSC